MSEWCTNRLEFSGKSVCIDILLEWVTGAETPRYRHAVQQSIRLFLAGCAGILKPTSTTEYRPYPPLIPLGTGPASSPNQAFEQWLGLLRRDVPLNGETIRETERLYHQTGLGALRWDNIPAAAQQVMRPILRRQYADWFGVVGLSDSIDAGECWERLAVLPEYAPPCDMLLVIPTRLAAEINGNGSLLSGMSTQASLYGRLYGMVWPSGHNVRHERSEGGALTVWLDSPWYPPSGELIGELSAVFDCQVRHGYCEPVNGVQGYDCYDQGEHVDGHQGQPVDVWSDDPTLMQGGDMPLLLNPEAASYGGVRG
jgi:hypothetical protein